MDKKPKIKSLDELAALWATRLPRATVVPISAVNKLGIDHVLSRILDHMNQGPKYFTKGPVHTLFWSYSHAPTQLFDLAVTQR